MPNELLQLCCQELRDKIASGQVKSVAATQAVLEAIEEYQPVEFSDTGCREQRKSHVNPAKRNLNNGEY